MLSDEQTHMFLSKRLYSKPKNDAFSLAEALGLLSPSRTVKSPSSYKPSLLQNLKKGSVAEQFKDLESGLEAEYPLPSVNHKQLFDSLVMDLHAVNSLSPSVPTQKSLLGHIKRLKDEEELLELLRLSYSQKTLSFELMVKFMLNRNLRTLSRLPFDVKNLDKTALQQNGWTNTNMAQFRILLMKKYHDSKAPLGIVRILKESFESEFLPLIQAQALSAFYERIVWKFYFDFLEQSQQASMVRKLNDPRHSFLIWEASAQDSMLMQQTISKQHDFTALQKLFVQLASWTPASGAGSRRFLSELKSISAKFKLYEVKQGDDVVTRAFAYSVIHKLQTSVQTHYPSWEKDVFLAAYMEQLHETRGKMVQQEFPEAKAGSLVHDVRYV